MPDCNGNESLRSTSSGCLSSKSDPWEKLNYWQMSSRETELAILRYCFLVGHIFVMKGLLVFLSDHKTREFIAKGTSLLNKKKKQLGMFSHLCIFSVCSADIYLCHRLRSCDTHRKMHQRYHPRVKEQWQPCTQNLPYRFWPFQHLRPSWYRDRRWFSYAYPYYRCHGESTSSSLSFQDSFSCLTKGQSHWSFSEPITLNCDTLLVLEDKAGPETMLRPGRQWWEGTDPSVYVSLHSFFGKLVRLLFVVEI